MPGTGVKFHEEIGNNILSKVIPILQCMKPLNHYFWKHYACSPYPTLI